MSKSDSDKSEPESLNVNLMRSLVKQYSELVSVIFTKITNVYIYYII